MATAFAYRAVDATGARHRGVEEAPNLPVLRQRLEGRGLLVLDASARDSSAVPGYSTIRLGTRRQVLEATRALATLLPAGLPLARALGAVGNLATGVVASALADVKLRVERGQTLGSALAEHPELFPPLYVGLVRAGEQSGALDATFGQLAAHLEREDQLRARLLSISIYPLVLALAGGAAVVVLLLFVMPRFVELLAGTGATLPRSTQLLLAVSSGLRPFWPVIPAALAAAGLLAAWWRRTPEGRRAASRLLLQVPLAGGLRRQALGARFARILGVLLSGGAPLLSALDDAAECTGDPAAREDTERIRGRVREGAALHRAIAEGALYPPLLSQLVAVGEESGRLAEFLVKAADVLEERTERSAQRLAALAEPAMILFFGGVVGFVALALLQAIYGINAGSFR